MAALDGLRILDMTQYEAGTSCTQALAWMGAEVVKIERPGTGDPGRGIDMGLWQDTEYFVNWNSNKRSVALDLTQAEGREILFRMLPKFDVFVENYGPGVVEKLGLTYEEMKALHPGLIYGRVKGFGSSGPYANFKSYDVVAQAASGAMSITGEADGRPLRLGPTIGDVGTGVQLALALLAAYIQKLRTGEGQLVEISMQEAVTYFMRTALSMGAQWGTRAARRRGNGTNPNVNLYPCKGGGPNDYIFIMAVTEKMWETVCEIIERPDLLEDERFTGSKRRRENCAELIEEVSKWTLQRPKHDAMRTLAEAGVPASAVFDTKDLYTDPHLIERGFVHQIEHEELGTIPLLGWPPRMSASEVEMVAAPVLGRHTRSVLSEELGISDAEYALLKERGVVEDARSASADLSKPAHTQPNQTGSHA